MDYNLDAARTALDRAAAEDRFRLLEHEVYAVLSLMGVEVPGHVFIPAHGPADVTDLTLPGSRRFVLKVVSPLITHKTEAGGVRLDLSRDGLGPAVEQMRRDVPATYAQWLIDNREMADGILEAMLDDQAALEAHIRDSIAGFLVVEQITYDRAFGSECMVGVRSDRAFGPVIVFGTGGVQADFFNERFGPEKGFTIASAELLADEAIAGFMSTPVVYEAMSGRLRGTRRQVADDALIDVIGRLRDLKRAFAVTNGAFAVTNGAFAVTSTEQPWTITECEVNPFVASGGRLVALDGVLRFEASSVERVARPYRKIGNLLEPETVGLIGVSSKKTSPAGTILANLLNSGIRPENVCIIHPTETAIAGCACYPDWDALKAHLGERRLDLFVVGVAAEGPPGRAADDVIAELIGKRLTESMLIISAGFGETERGQERNARLKRLFAEAHKTPDGGPVANGPNTLGNVCGRIDTRFTPRYKSSADGRGKQNCALICQSGAFMIARQSDLAGVLDPRVSISIGNQLDLAASDYLKFLKDRGGIDVIGVYLEGFNELDGLEFVRTAQEIVKTGRAIVAYKAGRTPEGKSAAKGHAASVAGDYAVAKALMEDAGVYVAEELAEFQDMLKLCALLADTRLDHTKQHAHIGAMSNAGFERCAIGDNVQDDDEGQLFKIADLGDTTLARVEEAFARYRIDDLVDISEILDLTPIANDETYADVVRAVLADPNVDAGIISIVPETVMLTTLDGIENEDIRHEDSICSRLIRIRGEIDKPFIVPIESGRLYEPMRARLQANGIPVFQFVDEATRTFGRYLRYRIKARL